MSERAGERGLAADGSGRSERGNESEGENELVIQPLSNCRLKSPNSPDGGSEEGKPFPMAGERERERKNNNSP